jgi:RNA recognition motif-containing protein
MRIYVGNLPRVSSEEELRKAFEAHGTVVSVDIVKDKFSGESRGFGFVEMSDDTQGRAAISALNGKDFGGRTLKIDEAKPRPEGGRGGGGGRRFGGGGGGGNRW